MKTALAIGREWLANNITEKMESSNRFLAIEGKRPFKWQAAF
jgi:hypothetical protein